MKLYIVLLLNGLVGGAIGPLPYDMDQCTWRVADLNKEIQEKAGPGKLKAECRFSDVRPAHDPSFGEVSKVEKP